MTLGVLAALAGSALSLRDGEADPAILVIWTIAAGGACLLTGGAAGPLAPWCLAPLASAAALQRRRRLALGAAGALAATGAAVLGALFAPLHTADPGAAVWLSLLSLSTTALGFAAALVTLQGRAGRELRLGQAAERRLAGLLERLPGRVLALDADGMTIEAFGPPLPALGGTDVVGAALAALAAAGDRDAIARALGMAHAEGTAEAVFHPVDDPSRRVALALRWAPGGTMLALLRDDQAQQDREAALEAAREAADAQNAGKSRFLANMSHELRTPLNAIMGFSDIMRQRLFGPVGDRYAEYAELIHESGSHLLELINDVLDMSKIEAERFELAKESFDPREAVVAVLRLMRGQADRAGVTLRAGLPRTVLEAEADRRAIKQIALNLISNALKFTPKGGSVVVELHAHGPVLELVVSDSGVGIAPEDLERLGRPFEQAGSAGQKAGGAGLGLSLVRAFARLHGGDMSITSQIGEGTTVTVRLPVLVEIEAEADEGRRAVANEG